MDYKATLGAKVDTVIYNAFNAYCKRKGVTVSAMLTKLVTDCVISEMPDYVGKEIKHTSVQQPEIINFFTK